MEVYKSKYLQVAYHREYQLVEMTWLPATQTMNKEDYKHESLNCLDVTLQFSPSKIINNATDLYFPISPELQEWTNQNIFPLSLEKGLTRAAFVVSKEIISQLSIEQIMEEDIGQKFISKYFDSISEAKEWIIK